MKAIGKHSRIIPLAAKFTSSEAERLHQRADASGLTLSTLLHGLVTKGKVYPRPTVDPIAIEQWRALAPLAANINQLARSINQGQVSAGADVSDELAALRNTLGEIRKHLSGGGATR